MAYEVRGVVLPEREHRSFWIEGDVLRAGSNPAADVVVDGGFLVPGLVDVHTHPGTEKIGEAITDETLRRHLVAHRDAGVLAIRAPGAAGRFPAWVYDDPELPRIQSAGRWLATPGRFYPGFGRDVTEAELVQAAVEEAQASTGWCKVIGDWRHDDEGVPLDLLTAVVDAVHAIGGRVAVHCQTRGGSTNAVLAGADSLEHGLHLDPALIDRMAAQGTALVPTLGVLAASAERAQTTNKRDWLPDAVASLRRTVGAAHEAGVTVLAGTDSFPCGTVADESIWLARSGLSTTDALGAASWTARTWLGLPGLCDGAPADLVAYETDPTLDAGALRHPARIILRGRVVR